MSASSSSTAETAPARYLVGIDLGTTNCALAYIDSVSGDRRVRDFPVPQIVAPGETESRAVLPSFAYEPAAGEFPSGSLTIQGSSGETPLVGWFAQRQGALAPGRLISSAKSWLCHPGVDRTAPLLPWHGASDVPRISPVEASARYLAHLRMAWDRAFPEHPLAEQEVSVTVPASFDEVARELTVRAAEKAGLPRLTLLEEPQAVFYAWMEASRRRAFEQIKPGQLTLICDVGGGTSDFTLIEARPAEDGVRFHRVAVGEHLILGGDNMDLALAHHLEARLSPGKRLDPRRWGLLVQSCRQVKETLLGDNAPEHLGVSLAGGSRLLGGALHTEVSREDVRRLMLEGFFPEVGPGERPSQARSGFQEFGLPYAADAAVTRHLAAFLANHARSARPGVPLFPDHLLFNGGVFESALLRERLHQVLNTWRGATASGGSIHVLPNDRLDLAVARGAAHALALRRQGGQRIASGLARAYYIQVGRSGGGTPGAVCLAPAGLEEGQTVEVPQRFVLRLRQPVEFALFTSSTRTQDQPGDLVEADPLQLTALPPVSTVIRAGRSVEAGSAEVQLQTRLTEIGTLDVRCVEAGRTRSWKLEFDVRGNSRRAVRVAAGMSAGLGDAVEESTRETCAQLIREAFAPTGDPAGLVRRLEHATGQERNDWSLPLLRSVWEQLMEVESGRQKDIAHETRWLSLLGFALRPGYGYTVDDWRVQQTWKLFQVGTAFPRNEMCRAEWCILWRRLAGGLGTGHQKAILDPLTGIFRIKGNRKLHWGPHETAEIWRLLGSLELLTVPVKIEFGTHLLERLERRVEPALMKSGWWAFGRLGARVPAYGPLNTLIPADHIEGWLERLVRVEAPDSEAIFAAVQLARFTGDRYRDVSERARAAVLTWLAQHQAPDHLQRLVRDGGELESAEERQVFGEALPPGLHLSEA